MTEPDDEYRRLMAEAAALPSGAVKVELYLEAVSHADSHQRDDLAYSARRELLWATYDISRYELLLVHFAWCLTYIERRPDLQPEILWTYRWVIDGMVGIPELSRAQIENAIDDMTRHYEAAGYSLRPVQVLRRRVYKGFGEREMAEKAHNAIETFPRDEMADSRTTETAFNVGYLTFANRHAEAVKLARPFYEGQIDDTHFNALVLSETLESLARIGRVEEGQRFQKRAYPYAAGNVRFVSWLADQMSFLCLAGDLPAAATLAEKHFNNALTHTSLTTRLYFFRSTRLLLTRLQQVGNGARASLRVPTDFMVGGEPRLYELTDLAVQLDAKLADLATRFDARNGTRYYAERVAELDELNRLADKILRLRSKR